MIILLISQKGMDFTKWWCWKSYIHGRGNSIQTETSYITLVGKFHQPRNTFCCTAILCIPLNYLDEFSTLLDPNNRTWRKKIHFNEHFLHFFCNGIAILQNESNITLSLKWTFLFQRENLSFRKEADWQNCKELIILCAPVI